MKKFSIKIYYAINILVLLIAIAVLIYHVICNIEIMELNISKILSIVILYIIINFFKYIKMYLIFLDEKIPFIEFLTLYMKTTFASIAIPFKLGEIFSIYCYGYKIKNYKKGFIGILVNRFIDTIILLAFMIPTEMSTNNLKITTTSAILLTFVLAFLIFLIIMPATYKYLNKYLVMSKPSKTNVALLGILEEVNKIQLESKKILNGKVYLLILLSSVSWNLEYQLTKILAGVTFNYTTFSTYINAAFFTSKNGILIEYLILATTTILILTLITYMVKVIKGRVKNNEKDNLSI